MARRILKRAIVEDDLLEIASYIARDNMDAALRFFDAAEDAFRKLRDMPRMGPQYGFHADDLKEVRFWPITGFRNYLVFYLPLSNGIDLLRVLHGARDIRRLMGDKY